MSPRQSRDERRRQTRRDLLDAAAVVFARSGYHGTSVDEVAEAAGYTKGAVYSNFASKEALFLALLDEHLDQAVNTLGEVLAQAAPADRAALLAQRREKLAVYDRDWVLLETEFLLYAARNDAARERLAARQRDALGRLTELLRQHLDDLGAETNVDVGELARLLVAASDGLQVMSLTEPDEAPGPRLQLLLELLTDAVSS